MVSQYKILCTVYSRLVRDSKTGLWHYKKNKPGIYHFFDDNDSTKNICMKGDEVRTHEFKGFIINYNKSLYHIIGLHNFVVEGTFKGHSVYCTNKTDSYPIKIINNNGNIVKTFLIIVNSNYFPLGDKSRKFMIKDLESFDKDLSKDVHLRRLEPTYYKKDKHDINIFSIINLLKISKDICLLFHELINHPFSQLNKQYFKCVYPKRLDDTAIKLNIIEPGIKRFTFARKIKYDTEENRWMKYILENILHMSIKSIRYIRSHSKYFSSQPTSLFIKSLKYLYNYLNYINNTSFLKDISGYINYFPPKIIYLNNYLLIYKKYKSLFSNKINIENNVYYLTNYRYSYSIKSTSDLYELWTYIYTLRNLMHFGFNLYKIEYNNNKINIIDFLNYGLHKNTSFYLKNRNGTLLRVIYNESIDFDSKAPVYVFNNKVYNRNQFKVLNKQMERKDHLHDKPDIRVDIFNHTLYEGSIILDAKCSNKKSVDCVSRDVNQLLSYKYNVNYKPNIIKRYPKCFSQIHFSPIQQVFVLYAGHTYKDSSNICGIKYMNLLPKAQQNYSNKKFLIEIISNCNKVITTLNNKFRAR